MKRLFYLFLLTTFIATVSCGPNKKKSNEESTEAQTSSAEQEIIVSPVNDSPEFPDAILTMKEPGENASVDPGNVKFSFDVTNYELKAQTSDADVKMCANSSEGQHIHLILNNGPYTAHYTPDFEQKLDTGNYVVLAFLSRSYHESLKEPNAYVLRQITVGNVKPHTIDLTQPLMFYSRPKGTYTGDDTKKILLDFYLVNVDLSPDGYKVRATINGKEFTLTKWVPYFVEGLPMGTNTFKLELLDNNGNLVNNPFNPVERTITLEPNNNPA